MNPTDLNLITETVTQVIAASETSTRVMLAWVGIGSALTGVLLTAFVQNRIARKQRDTQESVIKKQNNNQEEIARLQRLTQQVIAEMQTKVQEQIAKMQRETQENTVRNQLEMQDIVSWRVAVANIAAKRQVWIDELRSDMSLYVASWHDFAYRWEATFDEVANVQDLLLSKEERSKKIDEIFEQFTFSIEGMRLKIHELRIRMQLRLNVKEPEHLNVRDLMLKLEKETLLIEHGDHPFPKGAIGSTVRDLTGQIISNVQEILKKEWDRIKSESYVDPRKIDH